MAIGEVDDVAVATSVFHPGPVAEAVRVLLGRFRDARNRVLTHSRFFSGLGSISRFLGPAESTSGPRQRLVCGSGVGGETNIGI